MVRIWRWAQFFPKRIVLHFRGPNLHRKEELQLGVIGNNRITAVPYYSIAVKHISSVFFYKKSLLSAENDQKTVLPTKNLDRIPFKIRVLLLNQASFYFIHQFYWQSHKTAHRFSVKLGNWTMSAFSLWSFKHKG